MCLMERVTPSLPSQVRESGMNALGELLVESGVGLAVGLYLDQTGTNGKRFG